MPVLQSVHVSVQSESLAMSAINFGSHGPGPALRTIHTICATHVSLRFNTSIVHVAQGDGSEFPAKTATWA